MRRIKVAATQMSCSSNIEENILKAERMIRAAAEQGANIVLIQELFQSLYFCQEQAEEHFKLASTIEENQGIIKLSELAKELGVVIPVSFFEKKNNGYYNSIAVIDADGNNLGIYRKTHIPDGTGYNEKFYFAPGDTGFKVFNTKYGKIGIGICWDQWFPETARALTLKGAEIILYPTAIGSEPKMPEYDSKDHWQRVMQGHSAANIVPVIASNRVGKEIIGNSEINFYGSSFITNEIGEKISEMDRESEGIITAEFDLDKIAEARTFWGFFRDRRPSKYKGLLTIDGEESNI